MDQFPQSADTARGYFEQARALIRDEKTHNAHRLLERAVKEFEEDAPLLNMLGNSFRRGYNPQKISHEEAGSWAIHYLRKAHVNMPYKIRYAVDYANILGRMGEEVWAEMKLLRLYDDRNPRDHNNIMVLTGLGSLYRRTDRNEFAGVCYGAALVIDSENTFCLKRLAELYVDHGIDFSDDAWDTFLEYRSRSLHLKDDPSPLAPLNAGMK